MKKMDFLSWIKLLATPVVLMLLGIILLVSPDSAASLLVRILGWLLITACVGTGIFALIFPGSLLPKVLCAAALGLSGIWMVTHPLGLAAWLGRLVGILLVIQGIQDLIYLRVRLGSALMPVLTVLVGAVLVLLPMTTSRLVFVGLGVVLLVLGVITLADRLKRRSRMDGPQDPDNPDIIDAL